MRKCNDSHIFLSVAVQCGPVHLPVRMSALTLIYVLFTLFLGVNGEQFVRTTKDRPILTWTQWRESRSDFALRFSA